MPELMPERPPASRPPRARLPARDDRAGGALCRRGADHLALPLRCRCGRCTNGAAPVTGRLRGLRLTLARNSVTTRHTPHQPTKVGGEDEHVN